jgi:hypothetical protein
MPCAQVAFLMMIKKFWLLHINEAAKKAALAVMDRHLASLNALNAAELVKTLHLPH